MPTESEKNDKLFSAGIVTEEKKKELAEESKLITEIKLKHKDVQNELLEYISKALKEAQAIDELARERKRDKTKDIIAEENAELARESLAAAELATKKAAEIARAKASADVSDKPKINPQEEALLASIVANYKADNEKRAALETLVVYGDKLQHLTHEERLEVIDARNNAMDVLGIIDNHFDKSDVENGFNNAAAKYQPEMMINKSDEEKQFARDMLVTLDTARTSLLQELKDKQIETTPEIRNQALQALNLTNENPSESEIKAAFKKELLAHNPQRIAQQGGSAEEVSAASEQLVIIKAARDQLLGDLQNKEINNTPFQLSPVVNSNVVPKKEIIKIVEVKDEKTAQNDAGNQDNKKDTPYSPSMMGLD